MGKRLMMITSARRKCAIVLVAAGVALSGASLAAGPAQAVPAAARAATAPAPGSSYVALGDSYAAGYGIGSSTGKPVAGCAQSTQDYPHQVAAALKLHLTDRSCSGAVTADIDTAPQKTSAGTPPRQDTALSKRTKLVTVTIGGNDLGFASIAKYCLADTAKGPLTLHPELNCKAHYAPAGGRDMLADTVKNVVVPRVARVLKDIHDKAPNAKVYYGDYPAISTTRAGSSNPSADPPSPFAYPDSCFSSVATPNSFPFTGVDTVYLQRVQKRLNAALAALVTTSGDHFVETYPQSLPHSACAGTADPWMNGITLDPASGGTKPGSLHPNLEGANHLAADLLAALGPQAAPTSSSPASSSAPAPPSAAHSSYAPAAAVVNPAANAAAPLANTGTSNARWLALVGTLLVLAGSGLLFATRRRTGAQQH